MGIVRNFLGTRVIRKFKKRTLIFYLKSKVILSNNHV